MPSFPDPSDMRSVEFSCRALAIATHAVQRDPAQASCTPSSTDHARIGFGHSAFGRIVFSLQLSHATDPTQ